MLEFRYAGFWKGEAWVQGNFFLFWLCEYVFKSLCFVLFKIFNVFILCGVELISNAVLISGVLQNDTVVHACVLFQVLFPFRMLHNLCASKSRFGILASPFHLDCWPVYAASPTTGRGRELTALALGRTLLSCCCWIFTCSLIWS